MATEARTDGEEQAAETPVAEREGVETPADPGNGDPTTEHATDEEGAEEPEPVRPLLACPNCRTTASEDATACDECNTTFVGRDDPETFQTQPETIVLRKARLAGVGVAPGKVGDVLKITLEVSTEDPLITYSRVAPLKDTRLDKVALIPQAAPAPPHPDQLTLDEAEQSSEPEPPTDIIVGPDRVDELSEAVCGLEIQDAGQVKGLVNLGNADYPAWYVITEILGSDPVTYEAWRAIPIGDLPEDGEYHDDTSKLDGLCVFVGEDEGETRHVLVGPPRRVIVQAAETEGDSEETPKD